MKTLVAWYSFISSLFHLHVDIHSYHHYLIFVRSTKSSLARTSWLSRHLLRLTVASRKNCFCIIILTLSAIWNNRSLRECWNWLMKSAYCLKSLHCASNARSLNLLVPRNLPLKRIRRSLTSYGQSCVLLILKRIVSRKKWIACLLNWRLWMLIVMKVLCFIHFRDFA